MSKSRRGKFSQFSTACITTVLIHLLLFYSSNSLFKSPLLFLSIVCEVRRLYLQATTEQRISNRSSCLINEHRRWSLQPPSVSTVVFKYGSDGTLSSSVRKKNASLLQARCEERTKNRRSCPINPDIIWCLVR